jgi:hypothetical protein
VTGPRHAAPPSWAAGRLERLKRISPRSAGLVALILALPIGLLLAAVVLDVRPLGDAFRSVLTDDGLQANALGRAYMIGGLLLLPIAAVLATWPMLRRSAVGRRRVYPLNLAVLATIGVLIWLTWGELAVEVIRCDVLGIPNCD